MEEAPPTTFGKALQAERKRLELTQAQLAERVGTTQQNVGHWEAGRALPRADLYEKLVDVFGKHSPVAALPPRGELVPGGRRIMVEVRNKPTFVDLPPRLEETPVRGYGLPSLTAMLQPPPEHDVARYLPAELQKNTEVALGFMGQTYRVDYLSPRLCVEIKTFASAPAGHNFLWATRLAMQQVTLYRAILREKEQQSPTGIGRRFVVALLIGEGRQPPPKSSHQLMVESLLLGLTLMICGSPEELAQALFRLEHGEEAGPEDDEIRVADL